jgi:hypothetical protein
MTYDYRGRKVVALLSETLEPGIAMNVVGHLSMAIASAAGPEIMGRSPLVDGSGTQHLGISRYAIVIKKAKPAQVRQAVELARGVPGLLVADFPGPMLETGHDDELAAALAGAAEPGLTYLGAMVYGESAAVDSVCRKYSLWR